MKGVKDGLDKLSDEETHFSDKAVLLRCGMFVLFAPDLLLHDEGSNGDQ